VPLVCDFDIPSPPPEIAAQMSQPQMSL